jgi:sterol 3beta-glucosyltransferase
VRVVIVTLGSRGDVQPYVALGAGLKAAGHEVVLATHAPFGAQIRARGLGFSPMEGDPREEMGTEAARAALESGKNPFRFWRRFVESGKERAGRLMRDCLRACEGAEAILFSGTGFLVAFHVAEALKVPFVPAYLQPVHRTRHMPDVLFPEAPAWLPFRGSYDLLSHLVSEQLLWQLLRGATNEARREVLGLPPIPLAGPFGELGRSLRPYLYGFSEHVVPRPPDWGEHLRITGYWFLGDEGGRRPPPGLEDFLSSGEPPVCVGFGSMGVRSPEETTALVLGALRLSGRRGVLLSGWGGIGNADLPDEVFKLEEAPHGWLFPRAAAVVHHGGAGTTGAGTTGAGLAAGVPSVVVPFFGDQNFWAGRVRALGAGPEPVPRGRLTAERLAEAIRLATSGETVRRRAAELGARVRG